MNSVAERVLEPQINAPVARRKHKIDQRGFAKEDIYGISGHRQRGHSADNLPDRELVVANYVVPDFQELTLKAWLDLVPNSKTGLNDLFVIQHAQAAIKKLASLDYQPRVAGRAELGSWMHSIFLHHSELGLNAGLRETYIPQANTISDLGWEELRRELDGLGAAWKDKGYTAPNEKALRELDYVISVLPSESILPSVEIDEENGELTLNWKKGRHTGFVSLVISGSGKIILIARGESSITKQFDMDRDGERALLITLSEASVLEHMT